MKANVFFLAGMLIAAVTTGQHHELKDFEVSPPTFKIDDPNSIEGYLQNKVEYPSSALKNRIQGTVVIGFEVNTEGRLKNIEVINSVFHSIDNEVIQALQETDKMWTPGTVNGKPVTMPYEVSVVFSIYPKDNFIALARKHLKKGNQELFLNNRLEKAMIYFNRGINYLPNDKTLLTLRGLCKYKLGDETGAKSDWDRSKVLAERNGTNTETDNLAKISENPKEYTEVLHSLLK